MFSPMQESLLPNICILDKGIKLTAISETVHIELGKRLHMHFKHL